LGYVVIVRRKTTSSQSAIRPAGRRFTDAPAWVRELLGIGAVAREEGVWLQESADFRLASVRIPLADAMDGPALAHAAEQAYLALRSALQQPAAWYPLRIWNFVPGILADGGGGMDRYMRFNSGRYRAFTEWFGGVKGFDRSLPTASAVGYEGSELVIHALAARQPGEAIANPRQVNPHDYSKRFGPLPPCFARAVRVRRLGASDLLMVGGTSSVRGEDSVHVGDLQLQLAETLENLAALSREAFGPRDNPLDRFKKLRVYHFRKSDVRPLGDAVARAFPLISDIEWVRAELCRSDLLVEIEGLAEAMGEH
jgi:chorismate lyase/3-hydroxybenzoate synthase